MLASPRLNYERSCNSREAPTEGTITRKDLECMLLNNKKVFRDSDFFELPTNKLSLTFIIQMFESHNTKKNLTANLDIPLFYNPGILWRYQVQVND